MKLLRPRRLGSPFLAMALIMAPVLVVGGCWPTPMAPGGEDDSEEREDGEGGPDRFQPLSLHFPELPERA
jgi:hypothetical protein